MVGFFPMVLSIIFHRVVKSRCKNSHGTSKPLASSLEIRESGFLYFHRRLGMKWHLHYSYQLFSLLPTVYLTIWTSNACSFRSKWRRSSTLQVYKWSIFCNAISSEFLTDPLSLSVFSKKNFWQNYTQFWQNLKNFLKGIFQNIKPYHCTTQISVLELKRYKQVYGMLLESNLCGVCRILSQRMAGKAMTSLFSKSL